MTGQNYFEEIRQLFYRVSYCCYCLSASVACHYDCCQFVCLGWCLYQQFVSCLLFICPYNCLPIQFIVHVVSLCVHESVCLHVLSLYMTVCQFSLSVRVVSLSL